MKIRGTLVAMVALAALSSAPVAAQGLTGTWQLSSETPRGTQTVTLELAQAGSALTGTVTMMGGGRRGGGGGGGRGARTIDIEEGTVDGSSFSFQYTMSFGDNSITQSYSGTFEGDSMQGTIEGGRGGGRPFTGARGG